jgi:branched-chain amino acid transport system permease protein
VVEFVSPEVFGLNMVVLAFTMLYVGGIGTLGGPILGAVIVSLLPEIFRGLKDYQDLFYGAGLILLLIYAPKGLAALTDLMPKKGRP